MGKEKPKKSMWGADITPHIQSPWMIVKGQAEALKAQTNGMLLGVVLRRSHPEIEGIEEIILELVAPALDYAHRIMTITTQSHLPYPAVVDADTFRDFPKAQTLFGAQIYWEDGLVNFASTEADMLRIVETVLSSNQVVMTANGLLAKIAELTADGPSENADGAENAVDESDTGDDNEPQK